MRKRGYGRRRRGFGRYKRLSRRYRASRGGIRF